MIRNNVRDATRRVQSEGHKLTRPRRLIIEALFARQRAVTAADLLASLGELGVSLASIYRTLDLLVELGLAEPVAQSDAEQRYLACSLAHHHHVICDRCGLVTELDECDLAPFETIVAERTQYTIEGHTLEFHGRCPACRG
ncbi:MAG TPA: Fur family transcriptional regulator [Chloroflexota bacterium]|nr:Fur family transcriptional regulator [Chloroflexota bacterium]